MATVVTSSLMSTVAAMGMKVLRERLRLVKRTNREYEKDINAARPMSTVNVVVPAAITSVAVTPSHVRPGAAAVTPTIVPITLDQWYRAPFAFDDKQLRQVDRGIIPMQLQEAIKSLANTIENNIWLNYKKFYGFVGTEGTTPFGTDVQEFLDAEKLGHDQLMPEDRFLLMSTGANANWRGLRRNYDKNFADLGVDADFTQLVPTHTRGTANNAFLVNEVGNLAIGVTTTAVDTGTGEIVVGDVFSFASHVGTYTVTARTGTAPTTSISFSPPLRAAVLNDVAITLKATHVVNLYAANGAIAAAFAPMESGLSVPGGSMEQPVVDDDLGLALRLTVAREYYQTEWAFDALWGSAVPRPELGIRIAG